MPRFDRARRLIAITFLVILAAACSKTLDTAGLETELKSGLESQLNISGVTVECPADIKVEKGATFECSASDDTGAKATITVTQTDEEGNVRWEVTDVA